MNKTIIVSIVVIIAFGLLFWGGKSASKQLPGAVPAATAASAFFVPETSYDFGTISMKNGNVSRRFSLGNSTEKPITITRVTTSCMCTEAFLLNGELRAGPFGMPGHGGFAPTLRETIQPGESRIVEAVFDPAAHGPAGVGTIERAVFIEDADGGVQTLTFRALVTP